MAVRLLIDVNDISHVLDYYDQLKIYKSDSEEGSYVELTDSNTRIDLIPEQTKYFFDDSAGDNTNWYKTSYFDGVGGVDESDLSSPLQGGTEVEKIGYSFGNYKPSPGEWGKIITADDMRHTYLWGIDATASDVQMTSFEDEQFDFFIAEALEDFETFLTIDIRTRVYKTRPEIHNPTMIRGAVWREGVDYTDEEDSYSFDPMQWQNRGFLQLRHTPIQSLQRVVMNNQLQGVVLDLLDKKWVRVNKKIGQLNFFPTTGQPYGPFAVGVLPWRMFGGRFPNGYEVDYTTGYLNSDFIPRGLRSVIGKWACIKCLASIGDGLLAGFSSQSVSLDGLSESFSSTQSATSAFFGARIKQYQEEVKQWLSKNRYKYGAIPLSFVGY